ARHEIVTLRLAAGEGCVALLRDDVERGVLLLERLGPSMADLDLPLDRRTDLLVEAASRVWRPAPDVDLPTGADKAAWLARVVAASWEELGRPCSEAAVAHALTCAETRGAAHDDERAVLVHGDVHQWNALQAGDGFKLVDPDGLVAEPEYDLGILMREDPDTPAALEARCDQLAARTGLDATAIWEWGVVERVSTGLVCERIGLQPVGRRMLAAADQLAALRRGR
ncbi:MAG TPA: aminoglycoside phosphotransferase family protein, partial [Iamia sp.]